MLKLCSVLFVLITISLSSHRANGNCCLKTNLRFRINGTEICENFHEASKMFYQKGFALVDDDSHYCSTWVCGDGKPPIFNGYYCGKGSCNVFGCNCDGGCIKGSAHKSFHKLHGDKVYDVK